MRLFSILSLLSAGSLSRSVGIMNTFTHAFRKGLILIGLVSLACGLSCSQQNKTPSSNTQEVPPEPGSVADRLQSLERRINERAPNSPTPHTWVVEQVPEIVALMATNDFRRLTPQAVIHSALLGSLNSNFVFCQFEYTRPQQAQASFAVFGYERKPGTTGWVFTTTMPTNVYFDKAE